VMSLTQVACPGPVVPTSRLMWSSKYLLFVLNFEHCNFADVVYAQTATLHTN